MKYKIFTVIALLGSTVAELFGGWDTALKTLLIFMVLDWLTGGIILPAVFRKSPKSPNGALESRAGWKGLCRKGMTLLYVLIAARLDMVLEVEYIRNAVCIGFIANEVLSIVENVGLPELFKNRVYSYEANSIFLKGDIQSTYDFLTEDYTKMIPSSLFHFFLSYR